MMNNSPSKQKIADALKELLTEIPFSSIRVKQIADRAGVSAMTFYRCFSGKDDLAETICYDDLMLFTKIYGTKAELRSITYCMLNTIRNNAAHYSNILKDEEALECFLTALSHVTEETMGWKSSPATLATCKEVLKKWSDEDFSSSVDDIYKEWISTMPLKSVLSGDELEAAIKAFEAKTVEDFKARVKK